MVLFHALRPQSWLTFGRRRNSMRFVAAKKPGKRQSKQKLTSEITIPDKLYFRIGEVAKLCSLPPYVLRFWETEFPQLKPNKSSTNQRLYRRKDVENVVRVKRLLYEEGYTIPGARQMLKSEARQDH